MNQPQPHPSPKQYADYTALVSGDVLELLQRQATEFTSFVNSLAHKADYSYAPGKWTIKEMIGHIIDTERILCYRLVAIARAEAGQLPSFDEDSYVSNAHFSDRSLLSFTEEFNLLRQANLYLFRSLSEDELQRVGSVAGNPKSVKNILYTIAGHVIHHTQILKDRYL
jgi:hypothetical protein